MVATAQKLELTPRVQRLKEKMVPKSYRSTIKWHPEMGEFEDANRAYREGINFDKRSHRKNMGCVGESEYH